MTLTTENYGVWTAYIGTRAEVGGALKTSLAPSESVKIFHNGTAWEVWVRR